MTGIHFLCTEIWLPDGKLLINGLSMVTLMFVLILVIIVSLAKALGTVVDVIKSPTVNPVVVFV